MVTHVGEMLVYNRSVSSLTRDPLYVLVFYSRFTCVICFGFIVSTCHVIGWKDCDDTFIW